MRPFLVLIFLLIIGSSAIQAQETATCVTPHLEQLKKRLQYNQSSISGYVASPNAVQYVPLQFHLVGNDDGSNRIPEIQVLDMLCILNDLYEDQDIQFYFFQPFNYIDDSQINNQPNSQTSVLKSLRVANAINIFMTNDTGIEGGAGYYQGPAGWSGNDFIVVARSFAYAQNVLPHEIGHFFSLLHPFHGWENNPWDQTLWGNPVGEFAPSDPTLFSEEVLNERQDASNCNTAGDLICDTPPDYLFAQHPSQIACGDWFIPVRDPANVIVDPMENNVMSYFNACGNYAFTAGQKTAIINDLLFSPDRDYVRSSTVPDLTPIQEVPTLLFPNNGSTIPSAEQVVLSWIPVLTADFYVVEIDVTPTFTSDLAQSRSVAASVPSAIFENLAGNAQYYWRVRPYSAYITCTGLSDQWTFTTPASTSVRNITEVEAWKILPNPLALHRPLFLDITASQGFQAHIALYNWQGQLLFRLPKQHFTAGQAQYPLPVDLKTPGMYLLQIRNESGSNSQKLVVF